MLNEVLWVMAMSTSNDITIIAVVVSTFAIVDTPITDRMTEFLSMFPLLRLSSFA